MLTVTSIMLSLADSRSDWWPRVVVGGARPCPALGPACQRPPGRRRRRKHLHECKDSGDAAAAREVVGWEDGVPGPCQPLLAWSSSSRAGGKLLRDLGAPPCRHSTALIHCFAFAASPPCQPRQHPAHCQGQCLTTFRRSGNRGNHPACTTTAGPFDGHHQRQRQRRFVSYGKPHHSDAFMQRCSMPHDNGLQTITSTSGQWTMDSGQRDPTTRARSISGACMLLRHCQLPV